jgi:hypothetical protein
VALDDVADGAHTAEDPGLPDRPALVWSTLLSGVLSVITVIEQGGKLFGG